MSILLFHALLLAVVCGVLCLLNVELMKAWRQISRLSIMLNDHTIHIRVLKNTVAELEVMVVARADERERLQQ